MPFILRMLKLNDREELKEVLEGGTVAEQFQV